MTTTIPLRLALTALTLLATGLGAGQALAQYPTKPVTVMVPFGPGGSTDLAARAMAEAIAPSLGQPVAVVNKPGASGAVAMKALIDGPADGYTLLMAAIGTNTIMPAVTANLPFKHNQITPIARIQINPTVLVVRQDSPIRSVKELLETAKKEPGRIRASTAGVGTLHDFGIQILVKAAGLPPGTVTTVPYKGSAEAETALLGGHVEVTYTNLVAVIGHIKNGLIRPLAVVSPIEGKRVRDLPDVPTFAEAGFPQMDILGWRGVVGPPGLPPAAVETWEKAVRAVTEDARWRERIQKLGDEPGYLGSKAFGQFIDTEYKRFAAIAAELGIAVRR